MNLVTHAKTSEELRVEICKYFQNQIDRYSFHIGPKTQASLSLQQTRLHEAKQNLAFWSTLWINGKQLENN